MSDAYKSFGRGTPAGDAIFKLYHKPTAPSTFDAELAKRLEEARIKREAEANPKPKVVPKSRAHVNVPKPTGRPSHVDVDVRVRPMYHRPGRKPLSKIEEEVRALTTQPLPALPPKKHISAEDKLRLQRVMEFNGDVPEVPEPPKPKPKPVPTAPQLSPRALFDAIVEEIDERKAFLLEMRAGGNRDHEARIKLEISQRVAELKRLDKIIRDDEEEGGEEE
eukprot:TRINITY_DN5400_c0_g1_i1.p1 TRINITY_DN5400_c0_g1~~TRINITY_DN5400_c0_g1_i1.p1  ORF type:complete len:221 (-),score=40.51 TRINITY_DN5400_c0_g1_i1:145-807(-)